MSLTVGKTKLVCVETMHSVSIGETGTYTFGADYVPGWDAGRFDVTLDQPARMKVASHWTCEELLRYWQPIVDDENPTGVEPVIVERLQRETEESDAIANAEWKRTGEGTIDAE